MNNFILYAAEKHLVKSLLPPDFFQKVQAATTIQAVSMLKVMIKTTWPYFLILMLFAALVKLLTGRIGSLIYNTIYFGILFLVITIGGLEILFNPYFDFIYILFYPVSYFLTGLILKNKEQIR